MSSLLGNAGAASLIAQKALSQPARRVRIITQDRATPFVLEVDASIEEIHGSRSEVTRHPVESGANISDHVRPEPYTLQMTGQFSNHPLDKWQLGDIGSDNPQATKNRADDAYNELVTMQYLGERLEIITTLSTYRDMVLVSLEVPRNAKLANVVRFTAQFEQVLTVASETVSIGEPDTDMQVVKPKINKGKQATTQASEKKRAFAYNVAKKAKKVLGF